MLIRGGNIRSSKLEIGFFSNFDLTNKFQPHDVSIPSPLLDFMVLFKSWRKLKAIAYKLQLPPSAKINSVFHNSLLKKVVGNYPVENSLPPELVVEDVVEPLKILGTRVKWMNGQHITKH